MTDHSKSHLFPEDMPFDNQWRSIPEMAPPGMTALVFDDPWGFGYLWHTMPAKDLTPDVIALLSEVARRINRMEIRHIEKLLGQ